MKHILATALSATIFFAVFSLQAASLYWDPNATTGSALGGTGNWDSVGTFWYDGTQDNIWMNANGDDAFFTGTAGTATLQTNITAGDLYFTNTTGSYVLTNATGAEVLTLLNGTIDTGGGEHTIAAPIANSTILTKNGLGRLHLTTNNASTITGSVVINQGDISVENNYAVGQQGAPVTVSNGAALVLNGDANGSTNGLTSFTSSVTINGSGITNSGALRNLSGVTTFYGQIILGQNDSMIYVDTGAALVYDGENGPLTDNGNNYNLIISASGTGNFDMGATSIGGTLIVEGPASCYAYLNSIAPTVWKSTYVGPGATFYVENNNSFGANVNPASLMTTNVLLDGSAIISTGSYSMWANDGITVTTNGGTLTVNSGTWTTCNIYSQSNGSVTLGGSGSMRPGGAAGASAGTINLGTGTLTKSGSGDCNMGYANPSLEIYSNLVVNGGSLTFNYDQSSGQVSSLGTLPSTLNASNIIFNGGSMHVGHSTTIGATRGIYVASGGGTIEDVVSSGGTVTINSPISGPGSMNFPNGHAGVTSAVTLAANNTYTGTTTVGASSLVTVGAGGTTGTLGTGNTTDNGTLTFNRTGSYSYGGVISGSGWVTKTASGTVTLTGANTYTGNTTNSGGTLLINNTGKSGTGTGSVVISSGATLGGSGFISGAVTINSGATLAPGPAASSVGTLTISNNLTIAGNAAIAINKSLSPSNGAVAVTGTLANSGSGTLTVTNLGPALVVGDTFQIFSEPLTGNAMAVSGGKVIWNNNLAVDGSISVARLPIPVITGFSFSGSNIVFAGTNGYPLDGFKVLTSTNVAAPLTNWTTFSTGSYNASGNFAVTNAVTNSVPAQFFIIKSN
ncbi:MAG TPA: hypothetical protein VG754_05390 [Verrucomicrobiae bacterium]|nr:hypothetical protein [Verrucomicrobiae bacterium]